MGRVAWLAWQEGACPTTWLGMAGLGMAWQVQRMAGYGLATAWLGMVGVNMAMVSATHITISAAGQCVPWHDQCCRPQAS